MSDIKKAYSEQAVDSTFDAELDSLLLDEDLQAIQVLDKQFPGSAKITVAFAVENVNSKAYPLIANEVSVGGHAEGRSIAGATDYAGDEPVEDTVEYFVRPNGDKYYHRPWGTPDARARQMNDVEVIRKARDSDFFPLLQGPPGTGKTALVEAAFGDELLTIIGTGDTEVSDFIGSYVMDANGAFIWVDGPLIKAAEEGKVLLIDEIGLVDPKVLSLVYGLMDGRRELVVTANPERGTIKAAEGFFVVAATNPNAPGVRLSEALLSRFAIHVEITTDYVMAKRLGVDSRVVATAKNMDQRVRSEDGGMEWAPQMRELLTYRELAKAFGEQFALENLIMAAPESCRQEVADLFTKNIGRTIQAAQVK